MELWSSQTSGESFGPSGPFWFGLQATALRGTVDATSGTAGALTAAAAQTLKQKAAELHSLRLSGLALRMQREPSVAVNPLQAVKEWGENGLG